MHPLDGLNPASFRGVFFHVVNDKDGQGREGDVKTFPRRDGARVDDHGLGKREITVEAFIAAFEDSAVQAEAFRAAILAPGLGFLSLPNAIVPRALCTKCERSFSRDKVGRVAFSLTFVADDEAFGLAGLAQLGSAITTAASALLSRLPAMVAVPGASPYFAAGVTRGLGEAWQVVRGNLPAITTVPTLTSMIDVAADIPVRAVPGEALAAERIAKGLT